VSVYDLGRIGPMLENHPIFPERANISLAHVTSPTSIAVRTWERGAGLTKACGSAACAATVCGARKGLTGRHATVTLPGGPLLIEWTAGDRILMSGPVELEHEGVLEALEMA
jgi:diaminopimelate epimerase